MDKKSVQNLQAAGISIIYKPPVSKFSILQEKDAADAFNAIIDSEHYFQQNIFALFTDLEGRVLGWRHINRGSANNSLLDIKTIIAIAAQLNACGVYIGHTIPHSTAIEGSSLLFSNMCYVRHAFAVSGIVLHDYLLLTYNAAGRFEYKSQLQPDDEKQYQTPGINLCNIDPLRKMGMLMG